MITPMHRYYQRIVSRLLLLSFLVEASLYRVPSAHANPHSVSICEDSAQGTSQEAPSASTQLPRLAKQPGLAQQQAVQSILPHAWRANKLPPDAAGNDPLRASTQISPVGRNLSFQAREGEQVRFHYERGQWRAEVSSHIGAFARQSVLPVVCSQGEDVASSLEILSRYPSWHSQRRIHVLGEKVFPTLGEVVYVGELGLKGGGEGGEASGSGETAGLQTPSTLAELMSQEGVPDNDTLIETLNAAPPDKQYQWIDAAIQWFTSQPIET
ncbi:MAG: hypothetical protein AAF400_00510, partial [Bacteroidota bacterium]